MDQSLDVVDVALIRDQVRDFIQQNFLFDGDVSQLADDASLLRMGIVDTTGILEIVLFCEETYGFTVAQDDLVPENFDSVANMTAYVAQQLAMLP